MEITAHNPPFTTSQCAMVRKEQHFQFKRQLKSERRSEKIIQCISSLLYLGWTYLNQGYIT